eukprot:3939376-Pyramimonas_sp.AAC.1
METTACPSRTSSPARTVLSSLHVIRYQKHDRHCYQHEIGMPAPASNVRMARRQPSLVYSSLTVCVCVWVGAVEAAESSAPRAEGAGGGQVGAERAVPEAAQGQRCRAENCLVCLER